MFLMRYNIHKTAIKLKSPLRDKFKSDCKNKRIKGLCLHLASSQETNLIK